MKATLLLNLSALIITLLIKHASSKSYTMTNLNGNCLNCINGGYDFCTLGYYGGKVDPVNSVCCTGMSSVFDSCQTNYDACTWKNNTVTKYSKFFYCRMNSKCLKQGGIDGYIVSAFNTAP